MAHRTFYVAIACSILSVSRGSRLKTTFAASNSSRGVVIDPMELCEDDSNFSPDTCDMVHQWLVMIPSAEGVSDRWFSAARGRRNMHLTARVKPAGDSNKMLGHKMRTDEVKGGDPDWKQALVVPVVCPELPADTVIEINLRDERALLPNGQVGQLAVRVSDIKEGKHSYDVEDFKVKLDSKWCDSWDCVTEFIKEKDAASKPHLLHEGIECGASCHYLISTLNKNIVGKALKYLKEAEKKDELEDMADDRGDDAEDRIDDAEDAGNYHLAAAHKRNEEYWDEIEDEAEEDKEKAWDNMRDKLASIGDLLQGACGRSMPSVPLALGGKVKKDYKDKQVKPIKQYLTHLEGELKSLSNCLRNKWFAKGKAAYAPTSHADGGGCPHARGAQSYMPKK